MSRRRPGGRTDDVSCRARGRGRTGERWGLRVAVACGGCGRAVEVDPGYTPWCAACGWNLKPARPRAPDGAVGRIRVQLGRRLGRGLYEQLRRQTVERPVPGLATVAAVALAAAVYALTLFFAWLGIVTLTNLRGANFFGVLFGVLLLGLAWVMRPRLPALEDPVLRRHELPRLFALLERVARAVRAGPVHGVVITPEYNAGYSTAGWRRQRILFLGLPLFLALERQERVALLGHELGHSVNGDAGRKSFVVAAVTSGAQLFEVLEPDDLMPSEEGIVGLFKLPFRVVQLGMARAVLALLYAILLLLFRDGQRAEYYADALAARLAGRRAALALMERLHAGESVSRMTWLGETPDPIDAIVRKVRSMPAREIERIRRVERLEGSALDDSHPPTLYRIELLQSRPDRPPAVVLSDGESAAIDAELERFREPIGRRLVDEYLAAVGH